MDNFIVSARKYRPSTFDTVVGQGSITTTLKNALKNNQLAQAFLFCGPRGVGKTTCARILAKTINCINLTSTFEACDNCDSCTSFRNGQSLNVYELDAASNNSVEDIRSLIEQVRFAPQLGTHKVYIIDEVHMLSQSAFNAFLKTLEEPPAHAIFILATTEKHKIIPTILSRCQIFDFQRIKIDDMVKHLHSISQKESIAAETDALHIIAQKADGGLRDALSMFDQIVSFAGNKLTYNAVIENLNILDYDYYFKITSAILKQDIPGCLLTFNEILSKGFDGHNFINGLAMHLRNLLVCKDAATLQLLEAGENIKEKYRQQSAAADQVLLLNALNVANKADIQYKSSKNQRLLVELMLMQLCTEAGKNSSLQEEKKNDVIEIKAAKPAVAEAKPVYSAAKTSPRPVQETIPAAKPAASPLSRLKTISISGTAEAKQEKEPGQETAAPVPGAADAFTAEILETAWNQYAQVVKSQNKYNFHSTLSKHKPVLKENFNVVLTIDNEMQREELKAEQVDFLAYLRKSLNNYKLQLQVVLNEAPQEEKPYTARDKFKKMADMNPAIQTLKQKLDLEIDF